KTHNGLRQSVVLASSQIWSRISFLPCVLQPSWSDPKVRSRYVPSVLPRIRKRYWIQKAGLIMAPVMPPPFFSVVFLVGTEEE
ncbi:hypothetical protein V3C99_002100, partial [Haemonchus contortus]|uniref:Ovule protein n=1 Tax=Haemonchus contortus TaxID=6289 RepID=A0A7I4YAS5_HAECO